MGFDSLNHSLKIWESIKTPTPKMRTHLGVWGFIPSHPKPYTLGSMKCDRRASLLARTLASPWLGCEPKAKVAMLNQNHHTCKANLEHEFYPP
jgi:hypothetical protein